MTYEFLVLLCAGCLCTFVFAPRASAQEAALKGFSSIYHEGWIDFNENGRKDPCENPALPVTFPRNVGQVPYNFPYRPGSQAGQPEWVGVETRVIGALYPFGHGLSYTTFAYDLRVTPRRQQPAGTVMVSFEGTNAGDRAGDEVVQLYINDAVSSVATYTREPSLPY